MQYFQRNYLLLFWLLLRFYQNADLCHIRGRVSLRHLCIFCWANFFIIVRRPAVSDVLVIHNLRHRAESRNGPSYPFAFLKNKRQTTKNKIQTSNNEDINMCWKRTSVSSSMGLEDPKHPHIMKNLSLLLSLNGNFFYVRKQKAVWSGNLCGPRTDCHKPSLPPPCGEDDILEF